MQILERLAQQPHLPGRITCDPRVHGSTAIVIPQELGRPVHPCIGRCWVM